MSGVFISYRREDSGGYAGRLFDILSAHFGRENTFMDIDAISGGDNFVTVIEQKIGLCNVLLAVIGERWLTITGEDGKRRLDNSGDFVRLEIAKALQRGVRVIPVLVSKAAMPDQKDLPEDLRPLSLREAIDLRDEHFRDDAARLIELLDKTAPDLARYTKPNRVIPAVAAAVLAAVVACGVLLHRHVAPKESSIQAASTPLSTASKEPIKPAADITGRWEATVTYDWGDKYTETFDFEVDGTELSGTASLFKAARGIFDGKVEGNRISFTTKTITEMNGQTSQDEHLYKGLIEGNTVQFTMLTDSSVESHVPIHFTATRVK
ncbi:MAG TPA: toll/interleukin-1 receptor domain-containing protein [Acidisarcina sp.]